MKIIPFDFFDGKVAGEFHSILLNQKNQAIEAERSAIKDDCKLTAKFIIVKLKDTLLKTKNPLDKLSIR